MKCPICTDATLVMTERNGIEIDYCPTCRGVWLDRGELDKIIERAAGSGASAPGPLPMAEPASIAPPPQADPRYAPAPPPAAAPGRYYSPDSSDARYGRSGHRRKRRGFLDDLFDF